MPSLSETHTEQTYLSQRTDWQAHSMCSHRGKFALTKARVTARAAMATDRIFQEVAGLLAAGLLFKQSDD